MALTLGSKSKAAGVNGPHRLSIGKCTKQQASWYVNGPLSSQWTVETGEKGEVTLLVTGVTSVSSVGAWGTSYSVSLDGSQLSAYLRLMADSQLTAEQLSAAVDLKNPDWGCVVSAALRGVDADTGKKFDAGIKASTDCRLCRGTPVAKFALTRLLRQAQDAQVPAAVKK